MGAERTPLAEVLATLDELVATGEPITAAELGENLDCPPRIAAEQLDRLVERGDLNRKSVGESDSVWWRPDDADDLDRTRFRSLVQTVDEYAIFMLDPEGNVVTWNEGAERIKGYAASEIVGRHFSVFYTDEDVDAGVPSGNLETAAEKGRIEDEGWRVRKDGTRFWANVVITAIRDGDGTLQGFAKVTRDMTERREREQKLRRERDQTEQLLKTSPVPISAWDAQGEMLLANRRAREIFDLSNGEGKEAFGDIDELTVLDADGEPVALDELPSARVRETGEPVSDEQFIVERPDGDRVWLSVNAKPVFGPDGDLERIVAAGEEITEFKRRERELETELSEILGRISDAFYALDDEFRFTHVNERAEELLQQSEEELLGRRLWDVFPAAAEDDEVRDSFQTAMDTQEATNYEVFFPSLDAWVETNVYPSATGVSVYFRDVSDRIERERELRESERRYRTLAEHFPNGLVTLYDDDLRYTLASGQAFDNLDVSPEEVEGRTVREAWGDDAVADALEPVLRTALDGGDESVEVEYAGRQWVVHAVPITDADGDVFSGMTMTQDITERKEREQRLERFASVISHGLRNPLSIVQIYLEMAREEGDPDDFDEAAQALDRMETIIQNLLTTTVRGETLSEMEPVSLSTVGENAWRNVETDGATLRVEADAGAVVAAEDKLQTALENLFRNSVEYGDDGVEVRVGHLDGDGDGNGDGNGFYVEDDGPGISDDDRDEMFDYGYTSGSGTGIGLAVVRDVVDAHDWRIEPAESTDGGARFEIRGVEDGSDDAEQ